MSFTESRRLQSVQSPIIPVVGALIAENPGTISLGQGVVFYDPPDSIYDGIRDFEQQSANHRYQQVEGIALLRDEIAKKLQTDNGVQAGQYDIVVTAGSNMGFMNAVLAIADPGDEIIMMSPCYFNHEMAVDIAGCTAVLVPTAEDYLPDLEAIQAAITPRTRAVVTISPNNPTGAVYPEESLRRVNALCAEAGIYHISDEAYEYFVYDDVPHFSSASIEGSSDHTISLYSLSKSYSMASWRIGYMLIPRQLMSAVKKIQDTNLICPPVISQYAAVQAMRAGPASFSAHIQSLKAVRGHLLTGLGALKHVHAGQPGGAFYAFVELPDYQGDDMTLVQRLIEAFGVAVIPGSAFRMTGRCHIRVSYGALQPEQSKIGIERLVEGLISIA